VSTVGQRGAEATFYGVGVGPGDPELLTVKAVKILSASPVVAVPVSDEPSGASLALSIVKEAVDISGKEVLEIMLPMTRDAARLREARARAVESVATRLRAGRDVAFVTLGDPMLYSTFSYLAPVMREALPGVRIRAVPGITSFSAAASSALVPLASSGERLIVVPAAYDMGAVKDALSSGSTVVLMKVNRVMDEVIGLITGLGLEERCLFVSRSGWPDEYMTADIRAMKGAAPDYLSMIIVSGAAAGGGERAQGGGQRGGG
jgi:precorrin-2/cobalt-factor-2 C20-methyltransferase